MKDGFPILLPEPCRVRPGGGMFRVPDGAGVAAPEGCSRARAAIFQALEESGGAVSKGWKSAGRAAVTLALDSAAAAAPEGYRLVIAPDGIRISSPDEAGLLRAAATLRQIARVCGRDWPGAEIDDAPAFAVRGVLLDISRDKVPTMDTLRGIVGLLAELKFNRLELYTEHTFAYRAHPEVWAEASPITPDEVRTLDAWCREAGIELVPNQNSFGHMERWLKHPRYAPLAEAPEGSVPPWGGPRRGPSTLDPGNPASFDLVRGLYDELLPCFTSRSFNINCDETWELGQGRSRARCEAEGRGRVYLGFLRKLHADVRARGFAVQAWGDVVHQHPELIPELPRDLAMLEWGYEAAHDFDGRCARFADAGLRFLVCPGTSTWNSIAGRWTNALGNLAAAARAGLAHGAGGFVVTDWGDGGHWQPWPASWLPLAAASMCAWSGAPPAEADLLRSADAHVFHDAEGGTAAIARDLADAYRLPGREPENASLFFKWLQPDVPAALRTGLDPVRLRAAAEAIGGIATRLPRLKPGRPGVAQVRDELAWAAGMMRLGAERGAALCEGRSDADLRDAMAPALREAIGGHRRLWLLRNRPGGLRDSAGRLEALLPEAPTCDRPRPTPPGERRPPGSTFRQTQVIG
ncbi:MAG: family 20 glycosylhydrolase [Verrucomicrobia bacterium]|nr:family 20 glycosylhydrolase [Verrucomicrobiota bacterium]